MRVHPRRILTTSLASAVAASAVLVGAVPTAQASGRDCLASLEDPVFVDDYGRFVLTPTHRRLATDSLQYRGHCDGASVSVAISRPDGSDFRNVNGSFVYDGEIHHAFTVRTLGWSDVGPWVVRQIAAKHDGSLAVRSVDSSQPAQRTFVRRASVLTARLGNLVPMPVDGYLKAYSSTGTVAPMAPGRQVQVQLRPHNAVHQPYRTAATAYTSASGYWRTYFRVPPCGRWDVRAVFVTPYQTITSDYTFVGVVGSGPSC